MICRGGCRYPSAVISEQHVRCTRIVTLQRDDFDFDAVFYSPVPIRLFVLFYSHHRSAVCSTMKL